MHAEEAEIMAGTQAWHNQFLLGLGGGRFLQHRIDLIQTAAVCHTTATNRAEIREHAFSCRLHRRHSTLLSLGDSDQLLGAAEAGITHIEMIAHEVEEGFVADEPVRTADGMAVAQGLGLGDEFQSRR